MLFALVGLALIFSFLCGVLDSSTMVAMPISSLAIHPRLALLLAAAVQIAGPVLFGLAVATTIGKNLLNPQYVHIEALNAGLAAAIIWAIATWRMGIPSSTSHALIGGMVGASIAADGWVAVNGPTLIRVLIALIISPALGLALGYGLTLAVFFATRNSAPSINRFFRRAQIFALTALSLSYGANDAEKTMGVLSLGLVSVGILQAFTVPVWVVLATSLAIAMGMFVGGWRLIRTLGGKIYRVRPVHGFSSQIAGAMVILSAALSGAPVSSTQVMSSSIVGACAADRINMVRWMTLHEMATAWLVTIPLTATIAAVIEAILTRAT